MKNNLKNNKKVSALRKCCVFSFFFNTQLLIIYVSKYVLFLKY